MGKADPANRDRAEEAIEAFQEAERIDARPRVQFGDAAIFSREAKHQRARAGELLQPAGTLVQECEEAVEWHTDAAVPDRVVEDLVDTLQRPTSVSVGASEARLRAVRDLEILKPAVDAVQSARAANSIEKMLVHQMTAAHFRALKLLESSDQERLQPVDRVRLVNAAARMFDVYQTAALTLQKLKTKGQQRVIVQYQQVNVSDGGQAVVATNLRRGSRRKRRGSGKIRG